MTGRINRPGLLVCNRVYVPPLGVKQVFIFKFIFQKICLVGRKIGREEDWKVNNYPSLQENAVKTLHEVTYENRGSDYARISGKRQACRATYVWTECGENRDAFSWFPSCC